MAACICACSSSSPSNANPTAGQTVQAIAATCTSLGQEILKGATDYPETGPLVSFVGTAGLSDEEFSKQRQEYAACAKPILATLKEQLFGGERLGAIESAARSQPDVTALDQLLEKENAADWRRIDSATLRIATQCGDHPGSYVRAYTYDNGTVTETVVRGAPFRRALT